VSANSPIDRVIGVRWGLSLHASSFNLPAASKKLQSVLNFGQNASWKLLEIVPADLLDTLAMFPTTVQHVALLLTHDLFVIAIFLVLYVLDSGHSCTLCCIWCYAGVVSGCERTSLGISRTAV